MSEGGRDLVQPFLVESIGVRGRLVRLGDALDEILVRHDYPLPVSHLLAETVALAAAFASAVKLDGIFSLQVKGNGPVKTLVADVESPGTLRGYARFDAAASAGSGALPLAQLVGEGFLVWTVDPKAGERHQGIVALDGGTIAACAENYFRQSEQLRAAVRIGVGRAAGADGRARWRAGALMMQRIAAAGGIAPPPQELEAADEHWRQGLALGGSVTPGELIDPRLSENDLLYRLFHEVGVAVTGPTALKAGCRCNEARVRNVLSRFSADELRDMVVGKRIEVRCEFCNAMYWFDPDRLVPAPVLH
jgi:molecular chaperone Hsp33